MQLFCLIVIPVAVCIVGSSWILPCHGCTSCLEIPPMCRDLRISASARCVDIPCNYSLTHVEEIDLTLWNGCDNGTSRNYIHVDLLYSSNGDTRQLIAVNPVTGQISRSFDAAMEPVTQVYQFTYFNLGLSLSLSSSVNVTFNFASCAIRLTGPPNGTTFCPALPPDPTTMTYFDYPQLTLTASNVPDGIDLVWDLPVDYSGLGASLADLTSQAGSPAIYSPAVLDYGANPGAILISNYNSLFNFPPSSKTGIYGASNYPGVINYSGCQTLLFSVAPSQTVNTPYLAGSTVIEVCFDPAGTTCMFF
ncbi:uncharacterized protein LOC129598123 [Paramacrobiotus metropolitanus]|uniref:uncharacterized protein LOC129598123 n=1 Tax=Paramacrobiotus metropolitanus TaxID=2943436 RepID=UPI002445AB00|nr:uncharacterized protein LOC129598123 [Paramacrobiotus metropolitanus]